MRIRDARWVVLVAAIAVALVAAACGGSDGATTTAGETVNSLTVTVPALKVDASLPPEAGILRIVGRPSTTLVLIRVAGRQGLLGKQGLSARLLEEPALALIGRRLQTGQVDAAVVSSEDAVRLASSGVPLRIVMLLTAGTSNQAILARADIEGIAGLVGQRVAVDMESAGDVVLQGALVDNGVAADQLNIVPADGFDPGGMLVRGEVVGAAVSGLQAAAAVAADPTLQTLYTAGDHPGLISHVLVASPDTIAERPGQLLAFVRGWQAFYAVDRDQQELVGADATMFSGVSLAATMFDLAGLSVYDLAANAVELLPGGEYFDQTIGMIVEAALAAGWIAGPLDGQRLIDGSFVQAVASAR